MRDKVELLYRQSAGKNVEYKNSLYLRRGHYEIISVMDEGDSVNPFVIKGKLIDLFDPTLPVLSEKQVNPGQQAYLYNIDQAANPGKPQVLASASRVYEEKLEKKSYSFVVKSPLNTTNVMRILLPAEPKKITVTDKTGKVMADVTTSWDRNSKTSYLKSENDPEGINVKLGWK